MQFGQRPLADCADCILAHAFRHDGLVLKKGTRLTADHLSALQRLDVPHLIVAGLEPGDVAENQAAHRLAMAAAGSGLRVEDAFTGRSNLYAATSGLLQLDTTRVDALNDLGEAITLATLPPFKMVAAGDMVGTVKIIPLAVSGPMMQRAQAVLQTPILKVVPFQPKKIGVVSTRLPSLKDSVIDKTLRVLAARLAPMGSTLASERRVPHTRSAVVQAIAELSPTCDLLIVFGASAITDRQDVIPAALEETGGTVEHFGMPVDPGNLLLLGRDRFGKPVIGAPGCARSPKENGFDWILQRLLAGLTVTSQDIRRMGVGGLLMEIAARPQLRAGSQAEVEQQAARDDD